MHRGEGRTDSEAFLKTVTIGSIPGGTANAFTKCLLAHTGEQFGIEEAAYIIVRGKSTKMDLTELTGEY
jgi:diacylglycerol kinase family enzyme